MPPEVSRLVVGPPGRDITHLADCMFHHIDWSLVCAFVEMRHPDTNTFHMPFGEMTITLHDVFYILRVPIDGCLVEGIPLEAGETYPMIVAEFLGLIEARVKENHVYFNGGLTTNSITENYGRNVGRVHPVEASGYLLALLGTTLFVDKSKSWVSPALIPYASQLNRFYSYSWGSTTLAYLYRQLGIGSRAGCKQVSGCLTLLQAWIYWYFYSFRPSRSRRNISPTDLTVKMWPETSDRRAR